MQVKSFMLKLPIAFLLVIFAALLMSVFVLTLALLLWCAQHGADAFGYRLVISDEVQKTSVAVGGALGVALVALYGVHRQNLSAERRHRVDSSLALRKEIFLQVAEAGASQIEYLMSFADPQITDLRREEMMTKAKAAFIKLQMVASKESISAMLDANEEWIKVMFDIRLMPVQDEGQSLTKLCEIQRRITPFMRKLWLFNIIARKEIESAFSDDFAYRDMMEEKYLRVGKFFEELEQRIRLAQ